MLPCVSRSPETFSQSITATCSVTLRGAAGKIVLLPVHSCPRLPFEQNAFAFDAQRQSDSSPSFSTTRRHEIVSASERPPSLLWRNLTTRLDSQWRELHRSSDLMYWIEQKGGERT